MIFERLALINSWFIIAFLFFIQLLGMGLIISVFNLPLGGFLIPGLILLLGLFFSATAGCYSKHTSTWMLWIPAITYSCFIFVLSNRSFTDVTIPVSTNLFHPIEYAALGIFLGWGWQGIRIKKGNAFYCLTVFSTGTLYAIMDEIHQHFVTGRNCSAGDVALDGLGLVMGISFVYLAKVFLEPP